MLTRYSYSHLLLIGAGILVFPAVSFASNWRTNYVSLGGDTLRADVIINGTSGSYKTFDACGNLVGSGTLSNLQFDNLGGQALLRGNWQFQNGPSGTITWMLNKQLNSFDGSWSDNAGNTGNWSGTLSQGGGQLGKNGPLLKK